jgi:hypothetical protein
VASVTVGWETTVDKAGRISSRQVRRSVTGRTKTQVLARMREVQRLVDDGIGVPSSSLTVAVMLDHWLADVLPGTVAAVTEGQYGDVVRLYIKPRIGRLLLKQLAPSDVTRMLRDMATPTETRPNGYSANSRRLARSVLRRALRWAQTVGLVTRNVAALAGAVHVEQPEGRTMTPQQARVFLDHVHGDRLEAMYVVALSLGLRVSELLALGWDDVTLKPDDGSTLIVTADDAKAASWRPACRLAGGRRQRMMTTLPLRWRAAWSVTASWIRSIG